MNSIQRDYTRKTSIASGIVWMLLGANQLLLTQRVDNPISYDVSGGLFLLVGLMLIVSAFCTSLFNRVAIQYLATIWFVIYGIQFAFLPEAYTPFLVYSLLACISYSKIKALTDEHDKNKLSDLIHDERKLKDQGEE